MTTRLWLIKGDVAAGTVRARVFAGARTGVMTRVGGTASEACGRFVVRHAAGAVPDGSTGV